MRFSKGGPTFKTKHIEPIWSSELEHVNALRSALPGTVLVAFDLEFANETVAEIGLVFLVVDETKNIPRYSIGRSRFYDENEVETITIQVKDRTRHREWDYHGRIVRAQDQEEACEMIKSELDRVAKFGNLILVGYSMTFEFRWISRHFPAMASYFKSWVDVQELVMASHKAAGGGKPCNLLIGLGPALKALNIIDNRARHSHHFAVNDAVRALAAMAALLDGKEVVYEAKQEGPKCLSKFPGVGTHAPNGSYPHKAIVVAADEPRELPLPTRGWLCETFGKFGLKAVATNRRVGKDSVTKREPTAWWFAFNELEGLRSFLEEVDGSEVDGRKVRAFRRKERKQNLGPLASSES